MTVPPSEIAPPREIQYRPFLQVGFALVAMVIFSLSDVFSKQMSAEMSAIQISWFRYLGAVIALVVVVIYKPNTLRSNVPGFQVVRGLLLFGATTLLIAALAVMPVAEATTLVFINPMIVAALSVVVLKERIGMVRVVCIMGGLVGVAVVARPGVSGIGWAVLLPFCSALCWATAMVLTRITQLRGDGFLTTLVYAGFSGFIAVSIAAAPSFEWPSPEQLLVLAAMSLCWVGGQVMSLAAYRVGRIADVAPFAYSQIVWGVIFGAMFFGDFPDGLTLLGCGIVIIFGAIAARQAASGG